MAHDYRYQPEPMTINDDSKAIALALAFDHSFDFDTNKLQASINGSSYDGEKAISFALAKRYKKGVLFKTTYGQNNGKDGLTIGGSWRFK